MPQEGWSIPGPAEGVAVVAMVPVGARLGVVAWLVCRSHIRLVRTPAGSADIASIGRRTAAGLPAG